MKTSKETQNSLLSFITFTTSVGDFISLFAFLKIISEKTGSVLIASSLIPAKSLAILAAGFLIPTILNHFSTKKLFIITQGISFFLFLTIFYLVKTNSFSSILFISVIFFQTFLKQIFDAARENLSKKIGVIANQRVLQAQLLQGLYGAQFIGPIFSFFLIKYFGIEIPILIDALTYALALVLSLLIYDEKIDLINKHSIFNPIKYLGKNTGLRNIFILRTFGYWIPVGIFNYSVFSVIQNHYNLKIENSALVYTSVGLGSLIASTLLKKENMKWSFWDKIEDKFIATFALSLLALTRIGFISLPSFSVAIIILILSGICNGLNATATQSLRRKFTTNQQFPEIIGLELIIGKFVEFSVSTLCMTLMINSLITYQGAVIFSAVSLFVLAAFHLLPSLSTPKLPLT